MTETQIYLGKGQLLNWRPLGEVADLLCWSCPETIGSDSTTINERLCSICEAVDMSREVKGVLWKFRY